MIPEPDPDRTVRPPVSPDLPALPPDAGAEIRAYRMLMFPETSHSDQPGHDHDAERPPVDPPSSVLLARLIEEQQLTRATTIKLFAALDLIGKHAQCVDAKIDTLRAEMDAKIGTLRAESDAALAAHAEIVNDALSKSNQNGQLIYVLNSQVQNLRLQLRSIFGAGELYETPGADASTSSSSSVLP